MIKDRCSKESMGKDTKKLTHAAVVINNLGSETSKEDQTEIQQK